jgi:hypothetical protein
LEVDPRRYRSRVLLSANEGPPESLEPTRLELLADQLGIGPDALRELLRKKIAEQSPLIASSRTWRDGGLTDTLPR